MPRTFGAARSWRISQGMPASVSVWQKRSTMEGSDEENSNFIFVVNLPRAVWPGNWGRGWKWHRGMTGERVEWVKRVNWVNWGNSNGGSATRVAEEGRRSYVGYKSYMG